MEEKDKEDDEPKKKKEAPPIIKDPKLEKIIEAMEKREKGDLDAK